MKIFTASFLFLLSFLFLPTSLFASSTSALENIGLQVGVQSNYTNNIPIYITIDSKVDLTNATLKWDIPSGLNAPLGEIKEYKVNILSDETYYDSINISPGYVGEYNINVTLSGVLNGQTYVENESVNVSVGKDLKILENNHEYNTRVYIYYIASLAFLIILVLILKDVYKYSREKFHIWLDKD